MQVITSKDNETIKEIKKLNNKKYRDEKNEYIIEGIKLIKEAIKESAKIKKIIICDDCLKANPIDKELLYEIARFDCIYVSEKVFLGLTNVNTPQGILAVIEKKQKNEEKIDYTEDIIVILDGVQDPGNLGTILKSI